MTILHTTPALPHTDIRANRDHGLLYQYIPVSSVTHYQRYYPEILHSPNYMYKDQNGYIILVVNEVTLFNHYCVNVYSDITT